MHVEYTRQEKRESSWSSHLFVCLFIYPFFAVCPLQLSCCACVHMYVCIYFLHVFFLSLSLVRVCVYVHAYTRTGGRKVVQRSISLSHVLSASIVHSLTLCKDQNSYSRIRQTGRRTSNCCSRLMFLQINMNINEIEKE